MTAANSPNYKIGQLDGQADAMRIALCPPQPSRGPNPPTKYPRMYLRGYEDEFGQATPHTCTDECKRG